MTAHQKTRFSDVFPNLTFEHDRYYIDTEQLISKQGGYGVVIEVTDNMFADSTVKKAMKLLNPNNTYRKDYDLVITDFLSEIKMSEELTHPHIPRIYNWGIAKCDNGKVPYYVMEFIEGENLQEYLNKSSQEISPFFFKELVEQILL